jgi:hypothetical protein
MTAGTYTLRAAFDGTSPTADSGSVTIGVENGITINTPSSPQIASAPVWVSGSYTGLPTSITVVWRQGEANVGAPVNVGNISGGVWSGSITAPANAGTYTLRAAFNGTTPTADTASITIEEGQAPNTVANFVFEGTGAPANSIALFGHAFPQGAIAENDPVLLRRQDTDEAMRTQMNVLTRWSDNSVKTALLAAEMPSVADAATLGVRMMVGQTHPDPGSELNLAALLSGRTVVIKTWAPGDTTTPLWTFDAHANVGTDRWRQGPLAISTRVVTPVPSSAVQNTSGTTGVIESVRLIVDITATKDGYIEADVCFANDRVMHVNGGIARFGYTIEIDGEVLYDQRPSTGPARDLLQYSNWIRRVGRNADGSIKVGRGHPREELFYFRPDFDLLVNSGVQLAFDRSMPLDPAHKTMYLVNWPGSVDANHTNPYHHWSFSRYAGAVGGRPEIGYRAYSNAVWLRDGDRLAIRIAMRDFEAGATRGIYYYDWELDRWLNPVDWPKMALTADISSPAGTPRETAQGLPSNQRPTHNQTDHIEVDHAHHGSHNWTPALLAGRRLCYDSLAARSAWAVMDVQNKANGVLGINTPNWRTLTPDHTTGRAWVIRPWAPQVRHWAWDLRDIVDCAVILPDNYPNRLFYTRNAEAMFNSLKDVLPTIRSMFPPVLGLPMIHTDGNRVPGFMYSFMLYGAATAARTGIGGPNMPEIVRELLTYRANSIMDGGVPYRNAMTGYDLVVRGTPYGPYNAQSWADVWVKAIAPESEGGRDVIPVPPDWSVGHMEGDWQRNVLASFSFTREIPDVPLDLQAKLADALVLARSERQGANGHPSLTPAVMNGMWFMSNAVTARGISWRWDSAPTIVQGQSFQMEGDAPSGTIIGVVRFTGPVPRNSEPGLTPATQAWEIVSQPPGNPFTISMGGVLRLAGNPPQAGTSQVTLRCRTYNGNSATPLISDPVAVEVVTTAIAAQITNIAPASPQDVIEGLPIGTVIFTVTVRGNAPITPSITSGNTTLFEFVQSGGNFVVRVKASLTGAIGTYPLTLRVENAHGSDTANVSIGVVADAQPAIITPGQAVTLFESLTPREAEQSIAYTGDPPSSVTITAGDGGVLASPLTITGSTVRLFSSATIRRRNTTQLTPTVQMFNAANFDNPSSATVTVNIAHPWVHRTDAPSVVYIGVWSIARRLVNTYTGPLIRIRRASDNAEQDIGFVESGGHHVLDESEVTSFVGSSDWYIRTVYDQSLEGVNLEQPTTSLQPIGGTAGGFNRIGSNNRVAAQFGSNRRVAGTFSTLPVGNYLGVLLSARTGNSIVAGRFMSMGTNPYLNFLLQDDARPRFDYGNSGLLHSGTLTTNQTVVLYGRFFNQIGSSERFRLGFTGQAVQSGSGGNNSLATSDQEVRLGVNHNNASPFNGRLSELVLIREIPAGSEESGLYDAAGGFFGV